MSSVNSTTNSGIAALLQTLSAASPVLSSALSGANVQAALAKASPSDIVELSDAAVQLQQVGMLFGNTYGLPSSGYPINSPFSNPTNSLLQALDESLTQGTSGVAGSSASNAQTQGLAALFDTLPPLYSSVNTLA